MKIKLRKIILTDWEAVKNIFINSIEHGLVNFYQLSEIKIWQSRFTQDIFLSWLNKPEICCIIAEITNSKQPIAFGILNTNTSTIKALYVDNEYFKCGIGSKILSYFESEAIHKKNLTIYLRASLNAVNFYSKHGFQQVSKTTCFIQTNVKLDGIYMAKSLIPNANCIIIKNQQISLWAETFTINQYTPCLFISGAGASLKFWNDHFCKYFLEHGYGVIRYDHRDQGFSSRVDYISNPYTMLDLAQDVIAILDHYGIPKIHIIGHSMGGKIAQILALYYPKRLLSFTAISSSFIANPYYPSKLFMNKLLENKPIGNFMHDFPGFIRSWELLNGTLKLNHNMASAYTEDLYDRTINPVGIAWNHIKCQEHLYNIVTKINKIKLPGFFISGTKDPMVPSEDVIKNANMIKNSQVTILPQMGHMLFNHAIETKIASIIVKNLDLLKSSKNMNHI